MNRAEARDAIFSHVTEAWNASLEAHDLAGVMRYQDDGEEEPDQGAYWGRVTLRTVDERQEALRNGNTRRWASTGLVFVQIFVPRNSGQAQVESDLLAEDMRNALRDRNVADHLEFTSATIDDNVSQNPSWLVVLVHATFAYRQFI